MSIIDFTDTIEQIFDEQLASEHFKQLCVDFIQELMEKKLQTQSDMHVFYFLLDEMKKDPIEKISLIREVELHVAVVNWLILMANSVQFRLEEQSIQEILSMLDFQLQTWQLNIPAQVFEQIQTILQNILIYVEHSQLLKNKFMDCMEYVKHIKPEVVNIQLYAKWISELAQRKDDFYLMLFEELSRQMVDEPTLFQLIQGWMLRLDKISQKNTLFLQDKNEILSSYKNFARFLKRKNNQQLGGLIYMKYPQLFEYLFDFLKCSVGQIWELTDILNTIFTFYINCEAVTNLNKFPFILKILKKTISNAPAVAAMLEMKEIGNEENFVMWFVKSELNFNDPKETLSVYMSSQQGLEIFLILLIYYLEAFPQKVGEISEYFHLTNLLEQSRFCLDSEQVQEYMKILFEKLGEQDYYDHYLSCIQDQQIRSLTN